MKLYIDEITIGELLGILVKLPKYLVDVAREEIFWWVKLYKHEFSAPVDWQKEHRDCMAESRRRIERLRKKRV